MPEGTLQLEHLMQATKLLQLKKASPCSFLVLSAASYSLSPFPGVLGRH